MIVSFSGIDSAGKTTQIDLLYRYCKEHRISIKKVWSKARGTPGVMFIKELVRKDRYMDTSGKAEYRAEVFANHKKKRLLLIASLLDLLWYWGLYYRLLTLFYKVVLFDRYIWDSLVEMKQDFEGIDFENWFLWKLVKFVAPNPKHSFLFVIPSEVSVARDIAKNDPTIEDIELKRAKIDRYLALRDEGKWNHVIDGLRTIEDIHEEIKATLGV